jgi:hypothetical protein
LVAEFGPESLRLEADHYIVNWHSGDFALDPSRTYRILVMAGPVELGHADVDVVSSGRELRNVATNEYVALLDGRTLPIRFRIEDGVAGLLAWWPGDGDGRDVVGGRNGMLQNGVSFGLGVSGLAFSLDGIDDFIQVSSSVITTPPYTLCASVEPASIADDDTNRYVIANGGETRFSHGFFMYLSFADFPEPRWGFGGHRADGVGTRSLQAIASEAATGADWTFLCGSWDGSTGAGSVRLYVDGVLRASTTPDSHPDVGPGRNLRIGMSTGSGVAGFHGLIDEVMVFGRVLSDAEVAALYLNR